MTTNSPQDDLIPKAVVGDAQALERLLLDHYDPLLATIQRRMPGALAGTVSPEDVLQDTFVAAFRSISRFVPAGDNSFLRWLCTLARNRMADLLKAHHAAKRGGGRVPIMTADNLEDSIAGLLTQLAVDEHTPSQSAAGREAARAIHAALAGLAEDYRHVLTLRFVQGLSVAQTAQAMGRSEGAVQMLCQRAQRQLAAAMGRASAYFSSGA